MTQLYEELSTRDATIHANGRETEQHQPQITIDQHSP
jgi:hypothetical protein